MCNLLDEFTLIFRQIYDDFNISIFQVTPPLYTNYMLLLLRKKVISVVSKAVIKYFEDNVFNYTIIREEYYMNKTITIKGIGKLSLKPDQVVVSLTLKATDKNYDKAMNTAAKHLEQLRGALVGIGFTKDDLKTTNFNVGTEYESERDKNGNYKRIFIGYSVTHKLKLEFDFDSQRLSQTLGAIAACIAEPELNVQFTVKDKESVNAALLENACVNAKANAGILAKASGVTLGDLISIDYNWGELHLFSPTQYDMEDACMRLSSAAPTSIEIEPDDIDISDSVTFVWEISK